MVKLITALLVDLSESETEREQDRSTEFGVVGVVIGSHI